MWKFRLLFAILAPKMPLEAYVDQLEPQDQNATIWRFMDGMKFRDLITTSELYFCRSDRFQDDNEGMPPEDFPPDLNPLDLRDRGTIDDFNGCVAQFREAFYINCWHRFREETWKMWKEYGEDGVAICSQYAKLKSALAEMTDRTFIGLVQHEPRPRMRGNLFSYDHETRSIRGGA